MVVLPSGSKYGWEEDVAYMEQVNLLVNWLDERKRDPADHWIVCDYALVNFGVGMELSLDIALSPQIMRHSEYIGE